MSASSYSISSSHPRNGGAVTGPGKHAAQSSSGDLTAKSGLDSGPGREHEKAIWRSSSPVTNPSAAGLEDFGRTCVINMIRHLKTVWPLREGNKTKKTPAKRQMTSKKTRSTRALELQLKLHQERFLYDWQAHPAYRLHPAVDPYYASPLGPALCDQNLLPSPAVPPGCSIHPPAPLQAAK